ncbi:MAG: chorismate mutase [Clostridium argentinense]|uniref:chorismate mutase n=1 Tax=Clostridium faecium TaxID=2762223 RepID=A0ABR8YX37_9CLOT|nr:MULTISPECIES: chorismate mutase [Clostridium]MBD8048790.1 chorismate mutase [Clostridium faecium]MBS5823780.1 chorismate mutase [Clostridium argentinense]MDU1350188.1 chorismate mutase [Clostridium argentinense]
MLSIRGATTIEKNDALEIKEKSIELMNKILEVNSLDIDNIKVLLFSCTKDITKAYPGAYVREYFNLNKVSIMHFNEMEVENSLDFCIRLTILSDEAERDVNFVYLHKAASLRSDISVK